MRGIVSKKAQVTIFIILGLIVILTVAALIVYKDEISVFKPDKVVPPEVEPVKSFVESCVESTARDGIHRLSANGGFIRFPDKIELDPNSYISTNPVFDEFKTPLWRYDGVTRMPTESRIKEELRYYIKQNLNTCLDDLESFESLFDIKKGDMNISIELLERSTNVELHYPLEIKNRQRNQTTKMTRFRSEIPLRLKKVFELARKIMEEENLDRFLETRTIDLIALDSDIPYTNIEFSCEPKIWKVADVEKKLKRLLRTDLPLIRVEKTSYSPVPQDRPYEANHFIWEVTSLKYPDTHVSFTYDDEAYPMELYIRPNEGSILKSNAQKGQDILSALCMHLWHFTYDLKYPVLVTVTDDAGGGNEKLTFNFGIQVGINRNTPDTSNFGISSFDFTQSGRVEEFCRESQIQNILNVHTFENVSTKEMGDLYDELPGVNLTYTCISLKCPLGQSETQFRGAISRLSTMAPYCVNGVLRGEKEGYRPAEKFISTDQEKTVSLYLEPVIEKNITVKKHYIHSLSEEEELDEGEYAMVTVKRDNRKSYAVYPTTESLSTIEFDARWDYEYEIEAYLIDDQGGIIGGYIGNWTPSWDLLQDSEDIELHVIEYPYDPDEIEQLKRIEKIREDSGLIEQPRI